MKNWRNFFVTKDKIEELLNWKELKKMSYQEIGSLKPATGA